MASNYINNLSNTYQQSPSLQNQFATEQDYLDLFDNNQVTPQMATAYTPSVEKEGIESIINTATPIINQGGGDNDGPTDPTGFNRDDNLGTSDYQGTDDGTPAGGIAGTGVTGKGLMAALSFAFNPIGFFIGRYAKDKYKEYKEKKAAEEKVAREKNQAEINAIQTRIDKEYRDSIPGGNFDVSGPDTSGNPTGASNRASQERGHQMHGARGGFVPTGLSRGNYFKGGIVSLRRR